MEVDPRWLDVVAGRRYTQATAIERYPQITKHLFADLAFEMAQKPKTGNRGACDVKTYLAADIDALAARLAVPEPVDPRWLDVEAGRRYTCGSAMRRYPELSRRAFWNAKDKTLPFEMARRPRRSKSDNNLDLKTYLAADVDALVARLAAPPEPEPIDPRWLDVEAGRRLTMRTAMERYPELNRHLFLDKALPFEMVQKPKTGKGGLRDIKTYLPADVGALIARLAAPEPEPVDPRWLDVEEGRRYTAVTAIERYPQLRSHSFDELVPFEMARRPKHFMGLR